MNDPLYQVPPNGMTIITALGWIWR